MASGQEEPGWETRQTAVVTVRFQSPAAALAETVAARAALVVPALEPAFGVSLTLPIPVTLYPDLDAFVAAQPLAVAAGEEVALSVRSRQALGIALTPAVRADATAGVALDNALLRGLGYLVADRLSAGLAPDLFAVGLAALFERPDAAAAAGVARLREAERQGSLPAWAALSAPGGSFADPAVAVPASRSVAHFLVARDAAGLPGLLAAIGAGDPWRSALERMYGAEVPALEREWRTWLPGYLDGGWRSHPYYPESLAPISEAISAGRTVEAGTSLRYVAAFAPLGDAGFPARVAALSAQAAAGTAARQALAAAAASLADGRYEEAGAAATAAQAEVERYAAAQAEAAAILGADAAGAGDAAAGLRRAAAEYGRRAALGAGADTDLRFAGAAPVWAAPEARFRAARAAAGFTALGNQVRASEAEQLVAALDRRLTPAGAALVGAGLVVLGANWRHRRGAAALALRPERPMGARR
jgi:hypothetical protein